MPSKPPALGSGSPDSGFGYGRWTKSDPLRRRITHPSYVLPRYYVRVETENDYAMQRSSVVSSWHPFTSLSAFEMESKEWRLSCACLKWSSVYS